MYIIDNERALAVKSHNCSVEYPVVPCLDSRKKDVCCIVL